VGCFFKAIYHFIFLFNYSCTVQPAAQLSLCGAGFASQFSQRELLPIPSLASRDNRQAKILGRDDAQIPFLFAGRSKNLEESILL